MGKSINEQEQQEKSRRKSSPLEWSDGGRLLPSLDVYYVIIISPAIIVCINETIYRITKRKFASHGMAWHVGYIQVYICYYHMINNMDIVCIGLYLDRP